MPHSIEKIKSTLIGGGARPNLFQVDLTSFPGSDDTNYDSDSFSVLCKAAQLPASNVASIDVPFRGRIFKVAGDRTFDTWTVTVINDNDFVIRTAMGVGCKRLHNMLMDLVCSTQQIIKLMQWSSSSRDSLLTLMAEVVMVLKLLRSTSSTDYSQRTLLLLTCLTTHLTPLKNSQLNSKFNTGPQITLLTDP